MPDSLILPSVTFPLQLTLSEGGGESDFSMSMHKHYKFPDLLKSRQDLTVTAGWASAVTNVQRMIQSNGFVCTSIEPSRYERSML